MNKSNYATGTDFFAGCFVFGYFLWHMDFLFCKELTNLRRQVGIPWGFLLELHGWWHILTGIGAYTFIALVEWLTQDKPTAESCAGFAWPVSMYLSQDPKHS